MRDVALFPKLPEALHVDVGRPAVAQDRCEGAVRAVAHIREGSEHIE